MAYDKSTGQLVWETMLPAGTTGGPVTYEVDGRVIGGPAPRPLKVFTAASDGTTLTITLA